MLESCPYKKYPVLFVDDEELALLTYQNLFKDDLALYTAKNGQEALDVIHHHPEIVVLVTDQRMPKMSGLELLIRVAEKKKEMINILVTAYSDLSLVIEAINKGNLYRYVMKPYNGKILRQAILQGIERYHLIKERDRLYAEHIEWLRNATKIQRLKEIGTLTAGLAHDINNSLVAVNTFLKMIPQKRGVDLLPTAASDPGGEPDAAFWNQFHSVALGEVERIKEMVNHLLHALKLPENEASGLLHLEETDLNTLLHETILLVENEAHKKRIEIKQSLDRTIKKCLVDSAKIRQVFMNLLFNAIYATSEGFILVKTVCDKEERVRIVIEDTGVGISEENMGRLFSPFFSTKEDQGIGLGLTTCREIIEKHRGSIGVASKPGEGTTIEVFLPLHPDEHDRRYHTVDRRGKS
jgi:signal transduction histidine kinase